jgi:hypothetical protein
MTSRRTPIAYRARIDIPTCGILSLLARSSEARSSPGGRYKRVPRWHGELDTVPGSWVEWRPGQCSLGKKWAEMTEHHETGMELTNQANEPGRFIKRNQAAAD